MCASYVASHGVGQCNDRESSVSEIDIGVNPSQKPLVHTCSMRFSIVLASLFLAAPAAAQIAPAPYPYYPYPPPPAPAPLPAPPPPPPSPSGYAFAASVGAGGTRAEVDLGGQAFRTWSGGAHLHLSLAGFAKPYTGRLRLTGFVGGGGGGAETAAALHVGAGAGLSLGSSSQLFGRLGVHGYALKNDEVEANTETAGLELGFQTYQNGFAIELAPFLGVAPRSEYEPGDEGQGRRAALRLGARPGVGGHLAVTTKFVFLDVSAERILASNHLEVMEANLCVNPYVVTVCGFAQRWSGLAVPPGPLPAAGTGLGGGLTIPSTASTYIGLSIGIGFGGASKTSPFSTKLP